MARDYVEEGKIPVDLFRKAEFGKFRRMQGGDFRDQQHSGETAGQQGKESKTSDCAKQPCAERFPAIRAKQVRYEHEKVQAQEDADHDGKVIVR